MALGIIENGIVHRQDDGSTSIVRPAKLGGAFTEIAVSEELADTYRLATGEVVEGATEPIFAEQPEPERESEDRWEDEEDEWQWDEPAAVRNERPPFRPSAPLFPTERLTTVTRINGLTWEEAEERPSPRTRRSHSERTSPERLLTMAVDADDVTGRALDFAAPLGAGYFGVIQGPHGSGLTRTLRAVAQGIVTNAPDCIVIALLLQARSEEITDWRRRFPQADIVVCPTTHHGQSPVQTLRLASLVWETARRQTELGRDVVLLVDSLTGLWGAMLESEEADAQAEADQSQARQTMREWVQKAGCFHGETPLGGSLGGSLTILGTVWHQPIDIEAEEERDVHPHLRLLEYLASDIAWRVVLSSALADLRLYPAIDIKRCLSLQEERFLPDEVLEPLLKARGDLPRHDPLTCYKRLMDDFGF